MALECIVNRIDEARRLSHALPIASVFARHRFHEEIGFDNDGGKTCLRNRLVKFLLKTFFGLSHSMRRSKLGRLFQLAGKDNITKNMFLTEHLTKTVHYRSWNTFAVNVNRFVALVDPARFPKKICRPDMDIQYQVRGISGSNVSPNLLVHFRGGHDGATLIVTDGVKINVSVGAQSSAFVVLRDVMTKLRFLLMVSRDYERMHSPHTNRLMLTMWPYKAYGLCHSGVITRPLGGQRAYIHIFRRSPWRVD